jgi:hypothetical protein
MVRTECGPLAQLAEQQTLNLRVLGSIPRRLTRFPQDDAKSRLGDAECLRLRRTRHVTGARDERRRDGRDLYMAATSSANVTAATTIAPRTIHR